MNQVGATFDHLKDINKVKYDSNMRQAKFFVLRSSNDDDIHKVIYFLLGY